MMVKQFKFVVVALSAVGMMVPSTVMASPLAASPNAAKQTLRDVQQQAYRAWAPKAALPAAQRGVMLVADTEVVRGQCGCGTPVCGSACGCGTGAYGRGAGGGGIGSWMANHPILTTAAVATAIAVPLAVDDDDPPATP